MTTPMDPGGVQSVVSFPATESPSRVVLQPAPLIRPFRRISLPTFPSLLHRNSVASVSSFDSLQGDQENRLGMSASFSNPGLLRLSRPTPNGFKGRPVSVESPKRQARRRNTSIKPVDHAKATKRKQVVDEFFATEKAYVEGLEMIYSHFLTPIITSLETPQPLLDRPSLTAVFSNFVDIWNLHRSFLSALTDLLGQVSTSHPPPLSSLLLSHFPYLSLYNPFITSFPTMISSLTDRITPPSALRPNPRYNQTFATFISTQESDLRCGKLKLRDWLLTIVQRCPRYLLLLKDLIKHTEEEDPEYAQLNSVHALVTKITSTLNSSLQTQAQILSLLALQRSTTGLPLQLVEPGRMFFKRGPLIQIERRSAPHEREFLLFSDCLIWLANEDTERAWNLGWNTSAASEPESSGTKLKAGNEAESVSSAVPGDLNVAPSPVKKSVHPPPLPQKRHLYTGETRWIFKGQSSLVDIEVIVVPPRESGEERRFEVLSPGGSFVLYTGSEEERESWVSEIRQAKAQLLASLNVINPNSTLTSSSSTNHVRRSLQALPFPPSDERIATLRATQSTKDVVDLSSTEHDKEQRKDKDKAKSKKPAERRGKVENWVPAIWIPDEKTGSCMRCGRSFNWRRRRHHCRLCGRCVCASCSGRTFFISDPDAKEHSSKPARACEACYETVFPLIDPPRELESPTSPSSLLTPGGGGTNQPSNDTIASLSKLPSWVSMPSLPTQVSQPQALMVDLDLSLDAAADTSGGVIHLGNDTEFGVVRMAAAAAEEREIENGKRGRVRLKSFSRPKSYYEILEDFHQVEQGRPLPPLGGVGVIASSPTRLSGGGIDTSIVIDPLIEEEISESPDSEGGGGEYEIPLPSMPSMGWLSQPSSPSPRRKREDTARRSKRFSLPAVTVQTTTSVTARTTSVSSGGSGGGSSTSGTGSGGNSSRSGGASSTGGESGGNSNSGAGDMNGVGRVRRFSLVSGGRNSRAVSGLGVVGEGEGELANGVAAGKLAEILGKVGNN